MDSSCYASGDYFVEHEMVLQESPVLVTKLEIEFLTLFFSKFSSRYVIQILFSSRRIHNVIKSWSDVSSYWDYVVNVLRASYMEGDFMRCTCCRGRHLSSQIGSSIMDISTTDGRLSCWAFSKHKDESWVGVEIRSKQARSMQRGSNFRSLTEDFMLRSRCFFPLLTDLMKPHQPVDY